MRRVTWVTGLLAAMLVAGCTEGSGEERRDRRGGRGGRGAGMGFDGGREASAVPVEVQPVQRRDISSYIETNGILEAETEVDIVARTSAPIVELLVEEGMEVDRGQLLARLDEEELRAQLEIARVNLDEARQVHERARALFAQDLISSEAFDQARADLDSAQAQVEAARIQLGYAEIRAPFGGSIVRRYVDFAEQVNASTPLFRLSDFDPLLCPIQVPERELPRLFPEQRAYLQVESWPGRRFSSRVLRISPVVDPATGTVKVTLEVDAGGRLRPGMFARVFLETDSRSNVLVIPRSALSLESIGDTVYVVEGEAAVRREVTLGFREGDHVQVISGLSEGDRVVVVGQDGLSDGTPVQVLAAGEEAPSAAAAAGPPGGPGRPGPPDVSRMTPEQIERIKERMRARGLSEEQIAERLGLGDGASAPPPPRTP